MKKMLLLVLTLIPLMACADAIEIDGIFYNLIEKAKVAEVTKNPVEYSGSLTIPCSVTYNNESYAVTKIGSEAFLANIYLSSITIPESVVKIDVAAFMSCTGLTSIVIPEGVVSIEQAAFDGCYGLKSVTIPSTVRNLGYEAFSGCVNLEAVNIVDIEAWLNIDFNGASSNPLSYAKQLYMNGLEVKDISIPNGLTVIRRHAFAGFAGMNSVTIPLSVESIEQGAFDGCSGLSSLVLPNNILSIGQQAFYGCSGLVSLSLSSEIRTISLLAFYGCGSLTKVVVPDKVETIDNGVFSNCYSLATVSLGKNIKRINYGAFEGCKELTDVYCYADNVPITADDTFSDSYIDYATLHVPASSIEAYRTSVPWNGFKDIVAISNENTAIKVQESNSAIIADYYDLNGQKKEANLRGISIIKKGNGETRKVLLK